MLFTSQQLWTFRLCETLRLCPTRVIQSVSLSYFKTNGQSVPQSDRQAVPQSVFASSLLRDLIPDSGCNQDSCGLVCHGASSLSRGRVCLVTGHISCLCQAIYTYVFLIFFFVFLHSAHFFQYSARTGPVKKVECKENLY
jgi:hypothetical protein